MSRHKEEVSEDVKRLTEAGKETALHFLVGFNCPAVESALEYVNKQYPGECIL